MSFMVSKPLSQGLTAKEWRLIVGSLTVAVVLLLTALVVPMIMGWTQDDRPAVWAWAEAVLINVGAAIGLVAPIEWFVSRFRRAVEDSERRQDERVQAVRVENASKFEEITERLNSLEQIDQRVAQQLDDAQAADHAMFRSVTDEDATGAAAIQALTRATQRRLISTRGVRVPCNEVDGFHLWLTVPSGRHYVSVRVVDETEKNVVGMNWPGSMTAQDMLVSLGKAIRNKGFDARPSAPAVLNGLAETLVHADSYDFARPIIQHFPPQWALTDTAIVARGPGAGRGWAIPHDRGDRLGLYLQAREREGLHEESFAAARAAADCVFPLRDGQRAWR